MRLIKPDMSLLQIIELNPRSEEVFHQYDEELGACLLCNHLFDSLEDVAQIYQLDINHIFSRLQALDHVTKGRY